MSQAANGGCGSVYTLRDPAVSGLILHLAPYVYRQLAAENIRMFLCRFGGRTHLLPQYRQNTASSWRVQLTQTFIVDRHRQSAKLASETVIMEDQE
jgi:hypothetical protein